MERRRPRIRIIWVVIVLAVLAPVGWIAWGFYDTFTPTRSLFRYASKVNEYRRRTPTLGTDVTAFFPVPVPDSATNVRFIHSTPPGDMMLQLRCNLPPAELAALDARAAAAARLTGQGSDDLKLKMHADPNSLPPIFYDAAMKTFAPLPPSFNVYLIGQVSEPGNGPRWHYQYGVAVDRQAGEVVYFLQGMAQ